MPDDASVCPELCTINNPNIFGHIPPNTVDTDLPRNAFTCEVVAAIRAEAKGARPDTRIFDVVMVFVASVPKIVSGNVGVSS